MGYPRGVGRNRRESLVAQRPDAPGSDHECSHAPPQGLTPIEGNA